MQAAVVAASSAGAGLVLAGVSADVGVLVGYL